MSPCALVPQDRPYLLAHMSPSLVADVAAHTQARWLEAAPLLRGLPPALIVDLALRLGTRSFSPDEVRATPPRRLQAAGLAGRKT